MNKKKGSDNRYILIACMVSFVILFLFFFSGYYDTKRNMKKAEEYNKVYVEARDAIEDEQYELGISKIDELRKMRQENGCQKLDYHDSKTIYYFAQGKLAYANGMEPSEVDSRYLQQIPDEYDGDLYYLIGQFRVSIENAESAKQK